MLLFQPLYFSFGRRGKRALGMGQDQVFSFIPLYFSSLDPVFFTAFRSPTCLPNCGLPPRQHFPGYWKGTKENGQFPNPGERISEAKDPAGVKIPESLGSLGVVAYFEVGQDLG